MNDLGRLLIGLGLLLLIGGGLLLLLGRTGIPLGTSILLSVLLSVVFYFISRFRR
jgi:hypothetical protein